MAGTTYVNYRAGKLEDRDYDEAAPRASLAELPPVAAYAASGPGSPDTTPGEIPTSDTNRRSD